jgi:uncharacterized membrane protein YdbT with pleckstrin-like domain
MPKEGAMTSDMFPREAIPSEAAVAMTHSMLLPNENVIHVATIGRGIYWKGFALLLIGVIALQYSIVLAGYFGVIAIGLLLMARMTKKYLLLATTDQRVIIRAGVFNQDRLDLRHSKIESVETMRTLPGMLFGYGNVILSGTGRARIMVPFVQDAASFRDNLAQQLLERETPLPVTPYARKWSSPDPYAL